MPAALLIFVAQAYFLAAMDPWTPLAAATLAGAANLGGDIVLVCVAGWGIAGAALATAAAQARRPSMAPPLLPSACALLLGTTLLLLVSRLHINRARAGHAAAYGRRAAGRAAAAAARGFAGARLQGAAAVAAAQPARGGAVPEVRGADRGGAHVEDRHVQCAAPRPQDMSSDMSDDMSMNF